MLRQLIRRFNTNTQLLKRSFGSNVDPSSYRNPHRIYTPEQGFYWKSPYERVDLPNIPLDEYIWKDINKWQDLIALVGTFYSIFVLILLILQKKFYRILGMRSYGQKIYICSIT